MCLDRRNEERRNCRKCTNRKVMRMQNRGMEKIGKFFLIWYNLGTHNPHSHHTHTHTHMCPYTRKEREWEALWPPKRGKHTAPLNTHGCVYPAFRKKKRCDSVPLDSLPLDHRPFRRCLERRNQDTRIGVLLTYCLKKVVNIYIYIYILLNQSK
jgi:hypothetical protein